MDGKEKSNLNRSFSAPDISLNEPTICRRIIMEEFIYGQNTRKRVSRQFSYELLPGQADNLIQSPSRTLKQCFDIYSLPALNNATSYNCLKGSSNNMNCEEEILNVSPMDIDLDDAALNKLATHDLDDNVPPVATNLLDTCEIHYRGQVPILVKKVDKEVINNQGTDVSHRSSSRRKWVRLSVISIFVAIISILVYDSCNYNHSINVQDIRNDLNTHVINQNSQIAQMIKSIHRLNNYSEKYSMQVLLFIGTTGVGKTFCMNFIKRGFKPNQVYEIKFSQYNSETFKLHRTVPYLIVIENLKMVDTEKVIGILDTFPVDKSILVVLIYNIQDTDDLSDYTIYNEQFIEIPHMFEKTKYAIEVVKFNSFDKTIVKKYVSTIKVGKVIDDNKVFEVIDEHDFYNFGFKGFYSKLDLL